MLETLEIMLYKFYECIGSDSLFTSEKPSACLLPCDIKQKTYIFSLETQYWDILVSGFETKISVDLILRSVKPYMSYNETYR